MVARRYVPERGDIVWLDFEPVRGHEQGGKRPALVVSRNIYNAKTGLVLVCPITSRSKGYGFEVALAASGSIQGVVLADQVRTLDWRSRHATYIESVDTVIIDEVEVKLRALIEA